MDQEENRFRSIAAKLDKENPAISLGKMMSSPAITYKNKVIAFYHNREMTFKLGKSFDPRSHGIDRYSLLSPFKSKPPLAGWFQITFADQHKWEDLSRQALRLMVDELD